MKPNVFLYYFYHQDYDIYPYPALLAPLPLIAFTTEEIAGCTNEEAKGAVKAPRKLPSSFLFHA